MMIQDKIGVPAFHRYYQEASEFTAIKREERRKRQAIEDLLDPESKARKKLKKQVIKKRTAVSRKNKIQPSFYR
jgi:hypothetical protein